MRFLRFALCLACLPLAGLRAAEEKEEKPAPEEIPNFNQLDEYIYIPKSTLSLGSRFFLNGPRTTYSGQGSIPSVVGTPSDPSAANVSRTYIDGTVLPDTRTTTVSTGIGQSISVPIQPDGRTNTWSYINASQLQPNGDMTFHTYTGEVTDTGSHETRGAANLGLELIMDRDMGKLGKYMKWSMTVGFSLADIHSSTYAAVPTNLVTLTDTYDLFGQLPPPPPFTSPKNVSQSVQNSSGQTVAGSTQEVVQTILLGNQPIGGAPGRTIQTTQISSVNRYFIEGAFYTLRVGPTVILPIGQHLKLSMSAGPALIYSGSQFNVLEDLQLATGENYLDQYQKVNTKLLPGYYLDVNLRYELTDTAGFYVGGLIEGAGGYNQVAASGEGKAYATHIDFGSQEGVKSGLTVRF